MQNSRNSEKGNVEQEQEGGGGGGGGGRGRKEINKGNVRSKKGSKTK